MGPVRDALGDIVRFVPSLLLFIAILLIGWGLAVAARAAVHKVLTHVGFGRLVERGGVGRALASTRFDAGELLARLVYYAILLFALQLAFGVWGPNPVSDLIHSVVAWLPKAVVAIVIVVVAAALARGLRDLVAGALGGLPYGRLLANLGYFFVLGLGVIAALNQIGIATTVTTPVLIAVLATVAGILIVGVGGGLVRPMQQRWEGWLSRVEQEAPQVSERLRAAAEARRQEAEEARLREAEEARLREAEEARLREEARLQEEARAAEEARVAEEAKRAEQARAEQARAAQGTVDGPTMVVPTVPPAPNDQIAVPAQRPAPPMGEAAARLQAALNRPATDEKQAEASAEPKAATTAETAVLPTVPAADEQPADEQPEAPAATGPGRQARKRTPRAATRAPGEKRDDADRTVVINQPGADDTVVLKRPPHDES